MTSSASTLLFIYGTLKRGGVNHHVIASQEFVDDARTAPGFTLYDLGEYPGLIPRAQDHEGVAGEVWSVDPSGLARLDAFEGVAETLYRRDRVPLLAPFAAQVVEAYFYVRSVAGARPIPGGSWRVR